MMIFIIDTIRSSYYGVGLSSLLNPLTQYAFALQDLCDAGEKFRKILPALFDQGRVFISFDVSLLHWRSSEKVDIRLNSEFILIISRPDNIDNYKIQMRKVITTVKQKLHENTKIFWHFHAKLVFFLLSFIMIFTTR